MVQKSLPPDDCTVIIMCTETFWSPCSTRSTVTSPGRKRVTRMAGDWNVFRVSVGGTARKRPLVRHIRDNIVVDRQGWSLKLRVDFSLFIQSDPKVSTPDDCTVIVRCTETFWSSCSMVKTSCVVSTILNLRGI